MDKQFLRMFNVARYQHWVEFAKFDITKDRQDQLQDIWWEWRNDPEGAKPSAICQSFFHDWMSVDVQTKFRYTSMEQLWLAFVMEKIYGKVWSGTDWIKETK